MDLDRLTLAEARLVSRVIDLLPAVVTPSEIAACINVLECVVGLYRKEFNRAREAAAQHGDEL